MKTLFTSVLAFFLLIGNLTAAITLDRSSTKGQKSTSSITWNHVTGASASLIVVGVTSKDKTISSVTYGGTAMTLGSSVTQNSMVTAIYYMVSPAPGSNAIVVTASASTDLFAGAETYNGTDVSTPLGTFATNKSKSNSVSVTVSSATGNLVYQTVGSINSLLSSWGAGQTQVHSIRSGGAAGNFASTKAGAASVSMTASLNKNEDWGTIGVSINAAAAPLPVTFLTFDAQPQTDQTILTWSTAMETRNDFYTIERSTDGSNFSEIAKVPSVSEATTQSDYSFSDTKINAPVVYYRLSQTDIDGKTNLLSVVRVSDQKINFNTQIFPNPTTDFVNISIESEEQGSGQILLTDMNGKTILEQQVQLNKGNSTITIPMAEYACGTYFLLLRKDSLSQKAKIIKK